MAGSVLDAGDDVMPSQVVATDNLEACQDLCDGVSGCKSVRFCPNTGKCFIKDKLLSGTEAYTPASACFASYQTTCKEVGNENRVSKLTVYVYKNGIFIMI
jgi:hypothetical protein